MSVVNSIGEITHNSQQISITESTVAQSERTRTANTIDDAVIVDINGQKSSEESTENVEHYPYLNQQRSIVPREEAITATLSPRLVNKYDDLINLVFDEREKLGNFIESVVKVNKTV